MREISNNTLPETDLDAVFCADDYLYFYGDSLRDEQTDEQVAFLVRELGLETPMKILDLASGHGRHANRLARLGYFVTGVDRSREFLDRAQADAKKQNTAVTYLCADSRNYAVAGEYDLVIHLFSSFGYFTDAENLQVMKNIAASLKTGGLLCLDIPNRDVFLQKLPPCGVREKNGDLLIDRNRFDPLSGRLYNARIIIRNGKRRDMPFFLRLYNPTEIIALLETAGLTMETMYENWTGAPFNEKSGRMILIAGKE
jgi:2-polyprenyl-3-methyl-5-hydroxy-6-metoxy-1,4-benzoquinol methylase